MQKKIRTFGFVGAFVVIIGVVLAFRIHEFNNPSPYPTNEQIQAEAGIPVEVTAVGPRDISNEGLFTGTIEGFFEADVVSDVSQTVIALKARVGSRVSVGDTIAVLDTRSVSNMNLHYSQTSASYEDAKLNYERMQNLYNAGAVSKQVFEQAKMGFEIQKANYEAVKSAVYIASPIRGIVTETYVEAGKRISSGQPVAKVVRFDKVKIKIQVNESEINLVRQGQDCMVRAASFEQEFGGKVSEISLSADPRTRNFEVTVVVDNPELLLRSGMFASVRIVLDNRQEVLAVPKNALMQSEGGFFVYVLEAKRAAKREISLGANDSQFHEVLSGLRAGEKVVTSGHNKFRNQNPKVVVVE